MFVTLIVGLGSLAGLIVTQRRLGDSAMLPPSLSVVLGSIGLKTLQFFPVQATAFLAGNQATLAREKALAAIDLTVMAKAPCPATVEGA